jgi:hypothetical protein
MYHAMEALRLGLKAERVQRDVGDLAAAGG